LAPFFSSTAGQTLLDFGHRLLSLVSELQQDYRHARAYDHLMALDDHVLKDMGITRADVASARADLKLRGGSPQTACGRRRSTSFR
jgi:uncharacterized protein YjiS (DUF1127 family)